MAPFQRGGGVGVSDGDGDGDGGNGKGRHFHVDIAGVQGARTGHSRRKKKSVGCIWPML